jgi:hypothetical protein
VVKQVRALVWRTTHAFESDGDEFGGGARN